MEIPSRLVYITTPGYITRYFQSQFLYLFGKTPLKIKILIFRAFVFLTKRKLGFWNNNTFFICKRFASWSWVVPSCISVAFLRTFPLTIFLDWREILFLVRNLRKLKCLSFTFCFLYLLVLFFFRDYILNKAKKTCRHAENNKKK